MDDIVALADRTRDLADRVSQMREALELLEEELATHDHLLHRRRLAAGLPIANPSARTPGEHDADRRGLPRRRGNPVGVWISPPGATPELSYGWVVDRSPDGLCVVSETSVPVGTILRFRPADRVAEAAWFEAEVRNCRPERSIWILGCQFPQPLPWSSLRLFG